MAKNSLYRTSWLKRSFFGEMTIYYFLALFFFGVMQLHKIPAAPILMMQMALVFLVVVFSYLFSRKSIGVTCAVILVFQLIAMCAYRYFHYDFFNNPLGYHPLDAQHYDHVAALFCHAPLHEFRLFLDSNEIMLDDRGFMYLLYFIYKIAGSPERGVNLTIFFNAVAVTISSFYMYKLSREFVSEGSACFAAFVWGTQLFAVFTAACGLKENFMVMFILASLYFIARMWEAFNVQNMLAALFFATFALLFRMAIFYMLLASILCVVAVRYPLIKKYIVFFLIVGIIFTLYYFKMAFEEMTAMRADGEAMEYEHYESMVADKMSQGGVFASIVNYISAAIGPFPNIVSEGEKANYITTYSFSSFCKTFYAFYFLYGIYLIIKNKVVKLIPFIVFWGFEILMLIVTFYTLHDRYHWPHVPIVILISVWCGEYWKDHPVKRVAIMRRVYYLSLFFILIMFNYR